MKNVKKLSDEELVEIVRSKDQELYAELVRRYQDKLMRYASYLIKQEAKAADVVQESLIKAFTNLKSFKTDKKFSSWLYRIVHNQAINQIKKDKKLISLEASGWLAHLPTRERSALDDLSKKEIVHLVNSALKDLPIAYAEPLALYYLEEKSYEEISDILRLPLGTVGTRISRGRVKLKKIYQKKQNNESK